MLNICDLEKYMEETGLVKTAMVSKNNMTLHGVCKDNGANVPSPMVYLEDFVDFDTVYRAAGAIFDALDSAESIAMDFKMPDDPASFMENMFLSAVGVEGNEGFLEDAVWEQMEDIALCLYCDVGEGVFKVTKALLNSLGITKEDATSAAKKNMKPKIGGLGDFLGFGSDEDAPMTVITNQKNIRGAGAFFTDEAFDTLLRKFKDGFYMLPSSIHEVLAIPKGMGSPKELVDMVKAINAEQVAPGERLTNSVYEVTPEKVFKKVA